MSQLRDFSAGATQNGFRNLAITKVRRASLRPSEKRPAMVIIYGFHVANNASPQIGELSGVSCRTRSGFSLD